MVLRQPQERWYLYGNDVALAEALLRRDLNQAETASERAWLLKHWPSLGGFEAVEEWLTHKEPALLEEQHGRAAWLRVLQHQGDANPWRALVPPGQLEALNEFCGLLGNSDLPLDLWLGGGLGDQLETLNQLCSLPMEAWRSRLRVLLPLQSRGALEPFLQTYWPTWAPPCQFLGGTPRALDQRGWLSQMSWSFFLMHQRLLGQPRVLVPGSPDLASPPTLVCCWQSKVDSQERHWAHLRSWPFPQIASLYAELVPWAKSRGIVLIDITAYRSDECRTLQRYNPTLELAQSSINSFSDTAALLSASRGVITVDTALVHVAAWFGWPTLLLLHQYSDQRWSKRPMGLNQQQPLQVLQQTQYNCWRAVQSALLSSLSDWPWL